MKKPIVPALLFFALIPSIFLSHALAGNAANEAQSWKLPASYIPYNDISESPVKIWAYQIIHTDSDETTIRLLLKNTSELTVVGIQGTFELYNNDGQIIESIQGEPFFTFKDRSPLPSGSAPYESTAFIVEEGHQTVAVKPQITQVLFEDQSIWRGF